VAQQARHLPLVDVQIQVIDGDARPIAPCAVEHLAQTRDADAGLTRHTRRHRLHVRSLRQQGALHCRRCGCTSASASAATTASALQRDAGASTSTSTSSAESAQRAFTGKVAATSAALTAVAATQHVGDARSPATWATMRAPNATATRPRTEQCNRGVAADSQSGDAGGLGICDSAFAGGRRRVAAETEAEQRVLRRAELRRHHLAQVVRGQQVDGGIGGEHGHQ